jgi:hypothetical protein
MPLYDFIYSEASQRDPLLPNLPVASQLFSACAKGTNGTPACTLRAQSYAHVAATDGGFIPAGSALEVKAQVVLATVHVAATWAYDWARHTNALLTQQVRINPQGHRTCRNLPNLPVASQLFNSAFVCHCTISSIRKQAKGILCYRKHRQLE